MATELRNKTVVVFADEDGNLLGLTPTVVCPGDVSRDDACQIMIDREIVPANAAKFKFVKIDAPTFGRVGWDPVFEKWDSSHFRPIPTI